MPRVFQYKENHYSSTVNKSHTTIFTRLALPCIFDLFPVKSYIALYSICACVIANTSVCTF